MLELVLPYPPSVNRYYRHVGRRTLISREGRAYRQAVGAILARRRVQPLECPLAVVVDLFPPDRRRRDCDNAMKGLLDSIEHGGVFVDDSQIVHLEVHKREPVPGGQTVVAIGPHEDFLDRERTRGMFELVCCSGCGRDTFHPAGSPADAYCTRCLEHGQTHQFPEHADRVPLGGPEWFGGHVRYDLETEDEADAA